MFTNRHLVKQDFSVQKSCELGKGNKRARENMKSGVRLIRFSSLCLYKWEESFILKFPSSQYTERNIIKYIR